MEIRDARVNEYPTYTNAPELEVVVDELPSNDEFVWHFWEDAGVFWTEHDGVIQFLCHDGSDRNLGGFYGQEFTLRMDDGTIKTIRGPWSGDTYVFWQRLNRPVEPIGVVVHVKKWDALGYAGYYLAFDEAKRVLEKFCPEYEFVLWDENCFWWAPHPKDPSKCQKTRCDYCERRPMT